MTYIINQDKCSSSAKKSSYYLVRPCFAMYNKKILHIGKFMTNHSKIINKGRFVG